MAILVGEAHNLVFNGWTVARPHALDSPTVYGGVFEIAADQLVSGLTGVGDPAGQLWKLRCIDGIGEGPGRIVPGLNLHRIKIDRATIDAWRSSGLHPSRFESQAHETLRGGDSGRLTGSSSGIVHITDMDLAPQEGSRREHDGFAEVTDATPHSDTANMPFLDEQLLHQSLTNVEVLFALAGVFQLELIDLLVTLGTGCAHGGAPSRVEAPKLNPRQISVDGHLPTESIDLFDHVSLADPTDGRIAGHLPDRIEVDRE